MKFSCWLLCLLEIVFNQNLDALINKYIQILFWTHPEFNSKIVQFIS